MNIEKYKKILGLLMAIVLVFMSTIVGAEGILSNNNAESVDEYFLHKEAVINTLIDNEDELIPYASSGCHGTDEHYAAMVAFRDQRPYDECWFNRSLKTAGLSGSLRPDVILLYGNTYYVHEVVSPTQTVSEITRKIKIRERNYGSNTAIKYIK